MTDSKEIVEEILSLADIELNGSRPWDVQINNEKVFDRILKEGSLGLGESYMDGWWDCKALDQFFDKLLSANLDKKAQQYLSLSSKATIAVKFLMSKTLNMQNITRSKQVAEQHYNLGNDFYQHMLDPEFMQYTCGYFKDTKDLGKAQINKLNLVCKKLHLSKKGTGKKEKILELGSGFGGFGHFAAKNYNCEITSYNISKEQVAFAKQLNKNLPVNTIESDYRNAESSKNQNAFDKVVSIGMMEHVGPKNYKNFMKLADHCLRDDGILVIHTIGNTTKDPAGDDQFTQKYIFPGGHLPSAAQITLAAEDYFQLEDIQNFGHYYDPTLMAWFHNFNKNWPMFKNQYGDRFYRMWKYYLLSCAGAFRAGNICLYQFVFTKRSYGKVYEATR